jgi:hypothetical protein
VRKRWPILGQIGLLDVLATEGVRKTTWPSNQTETSAGQYINEASLQEQDEERETAYAKAELREQISAVRAEIERITYGRYSED